MENIRIKAVAAEHLARVATKFPNARELLWFARKHASENARGFSVIHLMSGAIIRVKYNKGIGVGFEFHGKCEYYLEGTEFQVAPYVESVEKMSNIISKETELK
jgi:hypothetical protein